MIFECDQDWGQMTNSGHGRHCEFCKRTVYDFSNKSNEELLSLGKGELCGMFLTEQVETGLIPIETPNYLKTTILTIGTILGLELSQVHGQDLGKGDTIEVVDKNLINSDTSKVLQAKNQIDTKTWNSDECKNVSRPKTKLYFTKSFPFLVRRKIRTIGRYRL